MSSHVIEYFSTVVPKKESIKVEMQCISREESIDEAGLYITKWYDYRMMTPIQATLLAIHHYSKTYGKWMGMMKGRDMESRARVAVEKHSRKQMRASYKLRQMVDRIGCRYDWFFDFAMERQLQRRESKMVPLINQLGTQTLLLEAEEEWRKLTVDTMQRAGTKRFTADFYIGHPDQDDYYRWLMRCATLSGKPQIRLATMLRERIIHEGVAKDLFGNEIVGAAVEIRNRFA